MAFASIETVRLLFSGPTGNARRILDERDRFNDDNRVVLAFQPLQPRSITVKGIRRNDLAVAGLRMNGLEWMTLPNVQIVPDTIAVIDSVHIKTIYVEGKDFLVDYELGRIRRVAESDINDDSDVLVYYQLYNVFVENEDFTVDNGSGIVTRISSGRIWYNETIWVDYSISSAGASDELLSAALESAHAQIVTRLAPPYTGTSNDALLAKGECELTCAIAARAMAGMPLSLSVDASSDDRALAWLKIADNYEQLAWKTLQPFLVVPRRLGGYAVKNG
jgi:hypothetical protein